MSVIARAEFTATTDDPIELEPPFGFSGLSVACPSHTAGASVVEVSNGDDVWAAVGLIPAADPGGVVIASIVATGFWYNPDITAKKVRIRKSTNGAQTIILNLNEIS